MTTNGTGLVTVTRDGHTCTFNPATHEYQIDGKPVPGCTQVLALAGLAPVFGIDAETLALASVKGTFVHEATALIDQGKLDWLHLRESCPELVPYCGAWQRFREREAFQPDAIEELVFSAELGVAGTLDRRGTWKGTPTVVDIKSGKKLAWTMGAQLAGYTVLHLVGAGVPLGKPLRQAFGQVDRLVVQLADDGSYALQPYRDGVDLDVFCAALTIAREKQRHHTRTKLPLAPETELDLA